GAAVENDEWAFTATAELVHALGDELLAGTALTLDEDRRVARRHALDLLIDPLHGGRGPDQRSEAAETAQLRAQALDLLRHVAAARDVHENGAQAREVDGFGQVIRCALTECLDRVVERGVPGDHDHLGRTWTFDGAQELEPVAVGQGQVDQDDLGNADLE